MTDILPSLILAVSQFNAPKVILYSRGGCFLRKAYRGDILSSIIEAPFKLFV